MTPRHDEVGVILEPHEIAFVQDAYVDCEAVRQSPINLETNTSEPIEFSAEQVNNIGLSVLVGRSALSLNTSRSLGARLLHPFETRTMREEADRLEGFYYALHNTLEASKQKLTYVDFVN